MMEPIAVNTVVTPAQVPGVTPVNQEVVVQPKTLVKDVEGAVKSVTEHYKSPAFWYHALLQLFVWVSYFQTASTPIQFGSLSVSLLGFVAYLFHLTKV